MASKCNPCQTQTHFADSIGRNACDCPCHNPEKVEDVMVKDMFGKERAPSGCCGQPVIMSYGPGYEKPVCSGCGQPVGVHPPKPEQFTIRELVCLEDKTKAERLVTDLLLQARISGMAMARTRVLQRTRIPADAKNPTRDATVLLGEEIANIISLDIKDCLGGLHEE